MLSVPYILQDNRPFHTAEGDVCVSWRSLFLTVLHFRAQVCLEDLKTQNPHPTPTQNKTKKKVRGRHKREGRIKNKTNKQKTHPHGALYANYVQCLFILKLVGK